MNAEKHLGKFSEEGTEMGARGLTEKQKDWAFRYRNR